MTKQEAIEIAVPFFERETGSKAYLIGANQIPRFPNQWNVLFESRSDSGKRYDGAIIVNVYFNGEARFFGGSL